MVDKGDYDGAIAFAAKKLRGKENKKTKYVKGLEKAFGRIMKRDVDNYQSLLAEERPENWDRIYNLLTRIDNRQNVVAPLLPLISNEGYEGSFTFFDVQSKILEAKTEATAFHYAKGSSLLSLARNGDKASARDAHHAFNTISRYFRAYKDSRALASEAKFLGTNRIHIEIANRTSGLLPYDFAYQLFGSNPTEMNSLWNEFYIDPPRDIEMDFAAVVDLVNIDVSRDGQDRNVFRERKTVQDGEQYVLDVNGNVKKDTLGNDITEPKFVDVEARVIEFRRFKQALLELDVNVIDIQADRVVDRDKFSTEVFFEDYSCEIRGDRRALSNNERNKRKTYPAPFPSDGDMLTTAAQQLSYELKKKLKRSFI